MLTQHSKVFADPVTKRATGAINRFENRHFIAVTSEYLGDTGAHETTADNGDITNLIHDESAGCISAVGVNDVACVEIGRC